MKEGDTAADASEYLWIKRIGEWQFGAACHALAPVHPRTEGVPGSGTEFSMHGHVNIKLERLQQTCSHLNI